MNNDKAIRESVTYIDKLVKMQEFSNRTKYPLTHIQLNFINGNRQIGKTIARVMETLTYLDEAPNMVDWQGPRDFVTDVGEDGLPTAWIHIDKGRQDWDQMADEFKARHMADLTFVDFIYTHGEQHFKRMWSIFMEIISSLRENIDKPLSEFTFNLKPVRFHKNRKTIHFEVNNHELRFRPLSMENYRYMTDPRWLLQHVVMNQKNERGRVGDHRPTKVVSDVDIYF